MSFGIALTAVKRNMYKILSKEYLFFVFFLFLYCFCVFVGFVCFVFPFLVMVKRQSQ